MRDEQSYCQLLSVTAQLICVFVFAYAKSRFSHDEAQIKTLLCFQHGEGVADVRTPSNSTYVDNIRTIYGPAVAR